MVVEYLRTESSFDQLDRRSINSAKVITFNWFLEEKYSKKNKYVL